LIINIGSEVEKNYSKSMNILDFVLDNDVSLISGSEENTVVQQLVSQIKMKFLKPKITYYKYSRVKPIVRIKNT